MKRTKRPIPTVTGIVGTSETIGYLVPQPAPHRCPNCGACPLCGHPMPHIAQPWVNPWPGYPNPYIGDIPNSPFGGTTVCGQAKTQTLQNN